MPLKAGPLFFRLTESEIEGIGNYLDLVTANLESEKNRLSDRLLEQTVDLSEEEKNELYEFHLDEYDDLAETFPRLFLNSLFVTTISLTEHRMARLVAHAEYKLGATIGTFKKQPLTKTQRKLGTLEKLALYLERVPGLTFPRKSDAWKSVLTYNRVRNTIIHEYGAVSKKTHADALRFLKKVGAISKRDSTIRLTRDVCKTTTADVLKLFELVTDAMPPSLDIT